MLNSSWRARVEERSRDHGGMIERTAFKGTLFVDRALAAFDQRDAGHTLFFNGGIGAQHAFEAASEIIRKKRVRARS